MGQKVNPNGMRVGVIRNWDSRWYASKRQVPGLLLEDIAIREYVEKKLHDAYVSKTEIERTNNKITLTIIAAQPGVILGKEGDNKKKIVADLTKLTNKSVLLNVKEVANPDLDATLVARSIAEQIENRASYRRAEKMAIQRAMRAGAMGIKTYISGRLGGKEIAGGEGYSQGTVPLQTLRADIDFAIGVAHTTYGALGIKVWICKGIILPEKKTPKEAN